MNKQDLIDAISGKTKLSKSQVSSVLNTCFSEIKVSLKKGKSVQLVGFGSWNKSARKARMGRNPQTGQAIKISARNVVKFSAGKAFKDLLN